MTLCPNGREVQFIFCLNRCKEIAMYFVEHGITLLGVLACI